MGKIGFRKMLKKQKVGRKIRKEMYVRKEKQIIDDGLDEEELINIEIFPEIWRIRNLKKEIVWKMGFVLKLKSWI